MAHLRLEPNTTLYPVPVVLVTCGRGNSENVFTVNRIASCNAEPPMIAVSVRPGRASHELLEELGEFVVNFPPPNWEQLADFVGSTTHRSTDKWAETGLKRIPSERVQPPRLEDCPVQLECRIIQTIRLPSHSLFIAEVLLLHAVPEVLDTAGNVDFQKVGGGLVYRSAVVRERPVDAFKPHELLEQVRKTRDQSGPEAS
jgi:flavin reductase (DIM6/NTAB) family NADH-FMN oxidoreductase RutF